MEEQEFQKHILKRIQKLEKKSFDATFEENYESPREQAEEISKDETNEHHIGKKSVEVLKQELQSHLQNHLETFNDDEREEWNRKKQSLIDQLKEAEKHG